MSQSQLFTALLITILMGINGARELWHRNYGIGALMLGIPVAGWLSMLFGR